MVRKPRESSIVSEQALLERVIDLYRRYHLNKFKRYPKADRVKLFRVVDMVRKTGADPEIFIKAQFEELHYLKPQYGLGVNIISSPKSVDRYNAYLERLKTKYKAGGECESKANERLLTLELEIKKNILCSYRYVTALCNLKSFVALDDPEVYIIWSHYWALSPYFLSEHPIFKELDMEGDITQEKMAEIYAVRKSKYKTSIVKREMALIGYEV